MRYIDADKMIADSKAMKQVFDAIEIDGIVKYVEEHSTDNVKKVVCCKDCKYIGIKDFIYGYCQHDRGLIGIVKPNDYCSSGEKK